MDYCFRSKRLGFRNWVESDIPKMTSISADPVVMEFFPYLNTPKQTIEFIKRMQLMYSEKSYCYFAVDELETGRFIGFIGLCDQDYESEFTPCVDIGWRLGTAFWNKGYATEGAKACLDYAFNSLLIEEVYSTTIASNVNSLKVMEKIGMSNHLEYIHPKLSEIPAFKNCVCYRISSDSYFDILNVNSP